MVSLTGGFLVCAFAVLILFPKGDFCEFLCFVFGIWWFWWFRLWLRCLGLVRHLLVMFGVGGGFSLARVVFLGFDVVAILILFRLI